VSTIAEKSQVPRGYCVSLKGISTNPETLKAVREWPAQEKINMKLEAFWAYARITGDLSPVSPT
jgi:hypothetical protein